MEPNVDSNAVLDLKRLRSMIDRFRRMEGLLVAWKEEVKRHFDVTSDHIRRDVIEANRRDIEQLKQSQGNHEARIDRLEKASGVNV